MIAFMKYLIACIVTFNCQFVEHRNMAELLVSVAQQFWKRHDDKKKELNSIPVRVLEILFLLLEQKQNHPHGETSRVAQETARRLALDTDGWLVVARLKDTYAATAHPGCQDNLRYRHELANSLLQQLLQVGRQQQTNPPVKKSL